MKRVERKTVVLRAMPTSQDRDMGHPDLCGFGGGFSLGEEPGEEEGSADGTEDGFGGGEAAGAEVGGATPSR